MTDALAEIANRYGATIPPTVTIKIIPRGVSGLPLPVWDGKDLTYRQTKEQRPQMPYGGIPSGLQARRKRAQARRERVREMHARGLTVTAMAVETGAGRCTLYSDLRKLGLEPIFDPVELRAVLGAAKAAQGMASRVKVAALMREGATEAEIRAQTGFSRNTVRRHIRAVDANFPLPDRRYKHQSEGAA
jgi:hypothetical protein